MPAPFFTTNAGDFTRLEGVYIFEQDPPAFVEGVFLNVVGVAGVTVRGPVDTPVSISSETQFTEVFGEEAYPSSAAGTSINKVREFLMNKPFGEVIVVRAAASGALAAEADFDETATPIINIAASSVGAWGNDILVDIADASDGNANHFNLVIKYNGTETTLKNIDVSATGNNNILDVYPASIANMVTITKLADGRPDNVTDAALADTAGSDGTIAATDYTDSGRALDKLANYPGVGIIAVADFSDATVKSKLKTLADAATDRIFLMWNGSHSETVANVITDVNSYRSDRVVYVYNSTKTYDFTLGQEVTTAPHSWVASILSQTDVDVHIGSEDSKDFTGGISNLQSTSITRAEYINLKEAGIAAWERDVDGGHLIVSGVTTSQTPGREELTRRRQADFLQLSVANRLRYFVKKKSTVSNRNQLLGEIIAFSEDLRSSDRIIEDYQAGIITSTNQRAQGIECIEWRVRLIGHMLHIVLKTEIGTAVEITEE